jgi:excisionase family DNA binding protein
MSTAEIVADGAVTVEEAVKLSGIGRTTLYALIGSGQITSAKIGKRRLIPRAELKRVLAENLVSAGTDDVTRTTTWSRSSF